MTEFIEINGAQHPISFTNAVLILYEREHGRPMLGDFNKVYAASVAMMQGDFSLPYADALTALVHMGIINGYREKGEPCPIGEFEVAEILTDFDVVAKCVGLMADALVKQSKPGEKKTKPGKAPAKLKVA